MLHFWVTAFSKAFLDSLTFIGQTRTGVTYAVLVLLSTVIWWFERVA